MIQYNTQLTTYVFNAYRKYQLNINVNIIMCFNYSMS